MAFRHREQSEAIQTRGLQLCAGLVWIASLALTRNKPLAC
jgi:hypothetical protein